MAVTRSAPPRPCDDDESESSSHQQRKSKKPRKSANKKYRLPLSQIHKYAEEGQTYLIPGTTLFLIYHVRIGNPPKGKEERRYSIRFWQDKFRVNDEKEVWNVNDFKSASFLQSLKEYTLPDVLKGSEDVECKIVVWRQGEEDNPDHPDNPASKKQPVSIELDYSSCDDSPGSGSDEIPDFTGLSDGDEGWDENDDTDDEEED